MRTTIDLPDPLYRQLKVRAASEGTTIREIVLEAVAVRLGHQNTGTHRTTGARFPVIHSKNPGSLNLREDGVYEYIPFP